MTMRGRAPAGTGLLAGSLVLLGASLAGAPPAVALTAPSFFGPPPVVTPTISEFSTGLNPGSHPYDIVVGGEGDLWFTDQGPPIGNPNFGKTPAIGRITTSGAVTEFSAGMNAGSIPVNMVMGPEGNMWFTDQGDIPAVGRITPNGTITEFSFGLREGDIPSHIVSGPDGNLWFTDRGADKAIGRVTPSGTITLFSSGLGATSAPWTIVSGPDGDLWFTDAHAPAIGRITTGGVIAEFSAGLNPGSVPYDLLAGPDGNLWFTDQGSTKAVGRISTAGGIAEFSSGLGSEANPFNIATGTDRGLWFTDFGATPAVGTIDWQSVSEPLGSISEYSAGLAGGSAPWEIVGGADGSMWFTNRSTPGIGRITSAHEGLLSDGITEFTSGLNAGSSPWGIVSGPDGNLWFTDQGSTPAIGRITTPPTITAAATATGPGSVAVSGTVAGHAQPTSLHVEYYSGGSSIVCYYEEECEWQGATITSSPEQSLGAANGDTPFSVTLTGLSNLKWGWGGDVGRVIRVLATNPTGTTRGQLFGISFPTATPPGGVTAGSGGGATNAVSAISAAQIAAALRQGLAPSGGTARMATLLRRGGFSLTFKALEAGSAVIDWFELPHGATLARKTRARPVLVAAGRMTFSAAATGRIKVKLTRAGRRLLRSSKRLKLTARGTFTATGMPPVVATKAFTLTR